MSLHHSDCFPAKRVFILNISRRVAQLLFFSSEHRVLLFITTRFGLNVLTVLLKKLLEMDHAVGEKARSVYTIGLIATIAIVVWCVTQGRAVESPATSNGTGQASGHLPQTSVQLFVVVSCKDASSCCPRAAILEAITLTLALVDSPRAGATVASAAIEINSSMMMLPSFVSIKATTVEDGGADRVGSDDGPAQDVSSMPLSTAICRTMPPSWIAVRERKRLNNPRHDISFSSPYSDVLTIGTGGRNVSISFGRVAPAGPDGRLFGSCAFSVVLLPSSGPFALRSAIEHEGRSMRDTLRSSSPSCIGLLVLAGRDEAAESEHYVDAVRECRMISACREVALPWLVGNSSQH